MRLQVSRELDHWLRTQVKAGHSAEALVRAMVKSGHAEDHSRHIVARAMQVFGGPPPAGLADGELEALRQARLVEARRGGRVQANDADNTVTVDGHAVNILLAMSRPRIVLFGNLLSDEECGALIELSRPRLTRSSVVSAVGGDVTSEQRTSMGTFFRLGENSLLQRIEARIEALTDIPRTHGEGMQILNYKPGAEYRAHHDYFNPDRPGEAGQLKPGGQRVATVVMYLNNVPSGGTTGFPRVGLQVAPVCGNAVLFCYANPDGSLDEDCLHSGEPVLQGEKWIATKWLRAEPRQRAD